MLRIYKSSAGSGKTYTLVKEYLRLAFKSNSERGFSTDSYKHILAITFTNKAAAEMKDRILSALNGISNGNKRYDQICDELCSATGKNMDQLKLGASGILRSMLHNYSDISVSTIDSFVHRVVRSFAYDLHLSVNFEIEMDSNKLLNEAVALLLDRLSETDLQITQAVIDFATSKIEEGKSWNIEQDLSSLGNELFSDEAIPHIRQLSSIEFEKLHKIRSSLHAKRESFRKKIFDEGGQAYQFILNQGLTEKDFHQGKKGVFGFFSKYAGKEFPREKKGNSYVKASMAEDNWGKKNLLDQTVKLELVRHYQKIIALWENEGNDYNLAELLLKNFYAFILLTDMQKLLEELKQENNILHISDFQQKVFEIVKEQDAPVIYERIGEKYDNILIDEFQDTSVIQWRNLLPLVENSQFKNEDSLIVGDGKQAIYRFRGGEVEQFAALPRVFGSEEDAILKGREIAIGNYGVQVSTLARNYRSRKEVIDFNNSLYQELLNAPELKNKSIYEDYFQEAGRGINGGFVRIEFLKDPEEEVVNIQDSRCLRVEEIIADVRSRGYDFKDIAILTRSNSNASVIASYLVERGIKVISPESLLIDHSPKVRLLLSVLRYLDRKDNLLARAEILYYAGLLLEKELHLESHNLKTKAADFELLVEELTSLPFRSAEFFMGRLSDLCQQLIILFQFSDDDPFLQFFSDEVLQYASRYGNDISEFLTWWGSVKHKKSIIYPESMDAVHIMTIHKSKGLQFPVVILADANGKMKLNKKYFWIEPNRKWLSELGVGILPVTKAVKETDFASLYEREEEQSFLDMLNLLYVGTTRPEDALYILSDQIDPEPEGNNSVTALLISFLKGSGQWSGFQSYQFGDEQFAKSSGGKITVPEYQKGKTFSRNISASAIKVRIRADLLWSEETIGKIDSGKILHEALKKVTYEGDEISVIRKMKNKGQISPEESQELLVRMKEVIYNDAMNQFFKQGLKVINERALLKSGERMHVPDRMVIHKGDAILLDYKTGKPRPEHRQQLRDYERLLKEAGIEVKKKILFYTASQKAEVVE